MKAGWEKVPLGEIATIERESIQPQEIRQGTKYVGLEHIETGGSSLAYQNVSEGDLASSKFRFSTNHILYGKLRPYLSKIICPTFDGICSTDILPILPSSRLEQRYLLHFLKQPKQVAYANSLSVGVNLPRLSPTALAKFEIPLPPLAEQRRIADVLDKAESVRAKRRAALAELDTLTQSLFQTLFGDPVANPKGWPTITLGDALLAIRNGVNAEQRTEPGGWPITRIETIANGTINPQRVRWIEPDVSLVDGFQLQPGDILFSHINSVEHIAKTAMYSGEPTPLIHGINLLRLRPKLDSLEPVWLLHLLKHDVVRSHFRNRCKRAVNQASLNQPDIKSLAIFLPPLPLQREFARQVAVVESLKATHRAALAELDALFATLQSRAFKGEL